MKKHPTIVEGFDGSLEELAQRVCRMRYDKVHEFFFECAVELDRQRDNDRKRGRIQLAKKLYEAAGIAFNLEAKMSDIFTLCEPRMQNELAPRKPRRT